jgi:hypothetical protein
MLSFDSRETAQLALDKLETIRKMLLDQTGQSNFDRPTFNTLNIQMMANFTSNDGDLATNDPVFQKPKSRIKVSINAGTLVYCGKPSLNPTTFGCYFTSPTDNGNPTLARINDGDVQKGDLLYWLGSVSGYQLDVTDRIDYEYLI